MKFGHELGTSEFSWSHVYIALPRRIRLLNRTHSRCMMFWVDHPIYKSKAITFSPITKNIIQNPDPASSGTMKFISITTIIMSAAVLAGIVTAQDPTGMPCDQRVLAEKYECEWVPGYNSGFAYLFFCSAQSTQVVVQTCSCMDCCNVVSGGVGAGGSYNCT
ncbi:uncharacterized protein F5147DRAFT_714860 [Suillus discolor]|uniref:Uncharacterized protein n=1 Tax=Suillus discolor TaxID=1912936 RepID=A0A9P7EYA2_9AGAM|nr:uncharacterized protein F5147DRAFT_714860 [Suillus discolor]KAG2097767.1 hypothetical protein F5147DRAFT_714860 [Suillus discolor]